MASSGPSSHPMCQRRTAPGAVSYYKNHKCTVIFVFKAKEDVIQIQPPVNLIQFSSNSSGPGIKISSSNGDGSISVAALSPLVRA